MMAEQTNRNRHNSFLNSLIGLAKRSRQPKVHDYTQHQLHTDYVFEIAEQEHQGYMTGQGRGIQKGDSILLNWKGKQEMFRVQAIDYYSSPSHMWIALLLKVQP